MKVHVDTEVDVDPWDVLESISIEELSDIVASRREAAKKSGNGAAEAPVDPIEAIIESIDRQAMDEAIWQWRRGNATDALFYLEKALGEEWFGLADIKVSRAA